MREEFIKCFVAKIMRIKPENVKTQDVESVIKILKEHSDTAKIIAEKMMEFDVFSYYGYRQNEKDIQYYFDRMLKDLKHWYDIPEKRQIVKMKEVVFWTFFLKKASLCKGNAYKLFERFLNSIGSDYCLSNCEDIQSAILYYVLNYKKEIEIWAGLLNNWNAIKKEYSEEEIVDLKYLDSEEGEESNKEKEEHSMLCLNFEKQIRSLSYNNLSLFLDGGLVSEKEGELIQGKLSSVERHTNNSITQIDNILSDEMKDMGGSTNVKDVLGINLIIHVFNCQKRRKWYVFRMFQRIIDVQINEFISIVDEYQKKYVELCSKWREYATDIVEFYAGRQEFYGKRIGTTRDFNIKRGTSWSTIKEDFSLIDEIDIDYIIKNFEKNKAEILPEKLQPKVNIIKELYIQLEEVKDKLNRYKEELWIEKTGNDLGTSIEQNTWKNFCESNQAIRTVKKEDLRNELENSGIVLERVCKTFNLFFDGSLSENENDLRKEGNALAKYRVRYDVYREEEGWDEDVEWYYGSGDSRPGLQKLYDLLIGKKEVSRELLLLVGLVHKAIVGSKTQLTYLQKNVLGHSRFDIKFKNTVFERFVQTVYEEMDKESLREERIRILQEHSSIVEKTYLREQKIAIFYSITSGERIEK